MSYLGQHDYESIYTPDWSAVTEPFIPYRQEYLPENEQPSGKTGLVPIVIGAAIGLYFMLR